MISIRTKLVNYDAGYKGEERDETIVAAEWRGFRRGVRFERDRRSSEGHETHSLLEGFDAGVLWKTDLDCEVQSEQSRTNVKELDERFSCKGAFSELDELGTGARGPRDYNEQTATAQDIDESLCLSEDEWRNLEILDWDTYVDTSPPVRRTGTVRIRFRYAGKSRPILPEDPWA